MNNLQFSCRICALDYNHGAMRYKKIKEDPAYHFLIFLISILLVATNLLAQDSTQLVKNYHHFGRLGYQMGTILKSNDFVKGNNATGEPIDYYQSGRIEFGWQTTGSQMWHAIWNYPTFGIGFYGVDYFNEDELGNPMAVYGFAEWPLERRKDLAFSLQLGFGLSFNWSPFDPAKNLYNDAIGDFEAAYIDVGINVRFQDFGKANHLEFNIGYRMQWK